MSNANEPAFPANNEDRLGLTKRELVAAMAMQGVLASPARTGTLSGIAEFSIMAADALLAQLERAHD